MINIHIYLLGISQNLNVPSPVLYQPGIFDNLSITSPNYGACILSLSNYYMQNLSLNYNVLTGQGVAITVNPTSVSKIADSLVNLNNISVCVTDIFGNIVSSSNFTITFNLSLNIIGGNSFTITNGCFSLAVVLVKPLRGLYTMLFQGPNLSPASLSLEIQPGSPVQISYLGPTISNNRDNITAKVVITDAAGNPVSTASLPNAVITFTSIFPLPLESNVGVSAPVQNGGAFFPSIYFIGIYGSYYNLVSTKFFFSKNSLNFFFIF